MGPMLFSILNEMLKNNRSSFLSSLLTIRRKSIKHTLSVLHYTNTDSSIGYIMAAAMR